MQKVQFSTLPTESDPECQIFDVFKNSVGSMLAIMSYDDCRHHRHRKGERPSSFRALFDQRWPPHAMGANLHGACSQGCFARSLFLLPAPLCFEQKSMFGNRFLERNQWFDGNFDSKTEGSLHARRCSAINFSKKTYGSTTISIAKHRVPCSVCSREIFSFKK